MESKVKIVRRKLSVLRPYWRNPRVHDAVLDKLKVSIERYGYVNPIVIDKDNVIVAGHARYRALVALGYDTVSCIVFEGTDKQAKEYRLVDNKLSEFAEWDSEKLKNELLSVGVENLGVFFEDEVALLNRLQEDEVVSLDEKIESVTNEMVAGLSSDSEKAYKVVCPFCGAEFVVKESDMGEVRGVEV